MVSKSFKEKPPVSIRDVLHRIVDYCRDPAELVEIYYWSLESGLKRMIRQFFALPEDVQKTLHAFLLLAEENPASVTVKIGKDGEITLSSPCVTDAARLAAVAKPESQAVH